jgi:macrolide-specific efflux system membrane fusion protein
MTDATTARSHRKTPRALMALGVVAIAACAGLLGRHLLAGRGTDTNIYAAIQKQDIEDLVTATGSLQPRDYVDVGAQVSGQLRKIHVEVGTEVREGDLLAEIDAEQSNARVDASKAQLRSQEAQLAQQNVSLAKAERDLQRQKNLMAEDATTAELVQNAESTLDTTRAQIVSLKAQMQQLQASMRVDQANLKYTKIFAPMDGTVVSISAKQGQTLNTNQQAPTILRIADLSTMTVQTQVSEADVSKLRNGMAAYFTTLGGGGRRYYGKLTKVEPTPTVTNNVVLYNALFDVPNMNNALLPQMTAQVFFVIAEARDVLAAPMSALTMQRAAPPAGRNVDGADLARDPAARQAERQQRAANGTTPSASPQRAPRGPRTATVKLAEADGRLVTREVQVGVTNRVHAEILAGLAEGDRVVAGQKVDDGAPAAQGQQNRNTAVGGFGPPGGFGGGR